mgnify:CR=1 FL=1
MYQALKNPTNGIPKLVEKVNFNKKYPQNQEELKNEWKKSQNGRIF